MDAADIERLCHAECFDHSVDDIALIETHISWVILTGAFAYKIKKPVDFGFLDFSTLDKRLFSCQEELRLNRRTSDRLYLDVVPVCEQQGRLRVGGAGSTVEYAVKMRQFDPHATLLDLLQDNTPAPQEFIRLGYDIGAFHLKAEAATGGMNWGDHQAVADPVVENFSQINERVPAPDRPLVAKLQADAKAALADLKPVFKKRKQAGYVRELHGDLHTGNIARIDGQWVPFDCIEFNPNLRWIDTASDIAFLVMDLQYRGFAQQANCLLNAYLEYTGDYPALRVLPFYLAYRAMVRAKVTLLRWQQEGDTQERESSLAIFRGYLHYCENLKIRPKPWIALTMGVSGSGKSTIARELAGATGAIHIRSDAVRKRQFGMTPDARTPADQKNQVYSAQASRQTFATMLQLADELLKQGFPVILDATFIRSSTRAPFLQLAAERGVRLAILCCTAPEHVLEDRIKARARQGKDPSEADIEVMRSQLQHVEPLSVEEQPFALATDEEDWLELFMNQADL